MPEGFSFLQRFSRKSSLGRSAAARQLLPVMEEIAAEMADKVMIYKMNVDEAPSTPSSFGIRSIPTLIMFKDGKMIDTKTGLNSKSVVVDWINQNA